MDLPEDSGWPSVPADLKYVELRMPGVFRELCADMKVSNEQIGRIIRCIALESDFFATPDVEPEISFYRQDQERRLNAKIRKAKSRMKLGNGSPAVARTAGPRPAVPKVRREEREKPPEVAKATRASPVQPVQSMQPVQPAAPRHKRTRIEKTRDDLSGDLFASMGSPEASTTDVNRAKGAKAPTVDTRSDAAWIPGKFAEFWKEYPKKLAKSDALKAFTRLIKTQPDPDAFMSTTLASLAYWKTQDQWTKDEGKFIPYPASWLNAGHWNDCEGGSSELKPAQAAFLRGDAESDEDLLKRMTGG